MTCEQRNLSALGATKLSSLEAAFQDELQRGGVKILPRETGTQVVLTVSRNLTDYVGTVQILHEGHLDTFIEALGPGADVPPGEARTAFVLEREFLFGQDEPMLDVALSSDMKYAEVLGLQGIFTYQWQADHWILSESARLPVRRTSPRDLRGFIYVGIDTEAVYLPGELCTASMMRKGWSCEAFHEQTPVRAVSPDILAKKKMPAWFSAAQYNLGGSASVVITGQDGLARLYEEGPNAVAEFSGWGAEIASLQNSCGNGWQLLVTGKTDRTKPDTVRAMEIQARQARDVSAPLELPGPIIALHNPMMRSAENTAGNSSAIAIVRNLQTGHYEAYRLTITCGN